MAIETLDGLPNIVTGIFSFLKVLLLISIVVFKPLKSSILFLYEMSDASIFPLK